MKKVIWIGLLCMLISLACSLSIGFPFFDGPNPQAQKSTLQKMQEIQSSQEALVKTQVAEGVKALALTQSSTSNQSPQTNAASPQPNENALTKSAQKTAEVARLLTSVPATPASEGGSPAEGDGFTNPTAPQIDPKGSDGTDFTDAEFKAWGQPNMYTYGVSIDLKSAVGTSGGKNYIIKVGDNLLEKCSTPLEYPNRLYCTGKPFQGGKYLIQVIENVDGQQIVRFATNYTFPPWTSTAPPPTKRVKKTEESE